MRLVEQQAGDEVFSNNKMKKINKENIEVF